MLKEDAGVVEGFDVGDVGGGQGLRGDGAGSGLDAGVENLAVDLLNFRAVVVGGGARGEAMAGRRVRWPRRMRQGIDARVRSA